MSSLEMKKGLEEESCRRVNGCQVLCTCKTVLALPETRQMMINQASSQWGISNISLLSQNRNIYQIYNSKE
jgi:hypothetical protein